MCPYFVQKYWFLKKLEHFQYIRVWPWKNGSKFDNVIGGHLRGPKFQNLFFYDLQQILGTLTQIAKKTIIFSLFYFKLKLRRAHCAPSHKANRVKRIANTWRYHSNSLLSSYTPQQSVDQNIVLDLWVFTWRGFCQM